MDRSVNILESCACALALTVVLTACGGVIIIEAPPEGPRTLRTGGLLPPLVGEPIMINANGMTQLPFNRQSVELRFPLTAGQTHLFQYDQSCQNSQEGACCVLALYHKTPAPGRLAAVLVDPLSTSISRPLEIGQSGDVYGVFYAESACSFQMQDLSSTPTASTVVELDLEGQSDSHTSVAMQQVGDRYYFRDISRRPTPTRSGGLAPESHIAIYRYNDYQQPPVFYPSSLISYQKDSSPPQTFGAHAADALVHTQTTFDFFLDNFDLDSWNDKGISMEVVINRPWPPEDLPDTCTGGVIGKGSDFNAFFTDAAIFFTPSPANDPTTVMSVAADIVGHEWGHAYLDNFSNLVYERESGALNEAFADWTGIRVSRVLNELDWKVGNRLRRLNAPNQEIDSFIRDLSTYHRVGDADWQAVDGGACPAAELCNDYCGVHTNNEVANHAFYLLAEGGTVMFDDNNPTTPIQSVTINGIGIDKAYQIAFAANRNFWTATTNFLNARLGMEMAAAMVFADQPELVIDVGRAWAVVGVGSLPAPASVR